MSTIQCPECDKVYNPRHESKDAVKQNNDPLGVEQHVTGLCSRRCYLKHIDSYVPDCDTLVERVQRSSIGLYLVLEEVSSTESTSTLTVIDEGPVELVDGEVEFDGVRYTLDEIDEKVAQYTAYVER